MAISNKPHSIISLLAFATMFLMLLNTVHSADSLSFSFDKFTPNQQDLIPQGDTKITDVIQLTSAPRRNSVGRVLYSAPVHLWDTSAVEAKFETTFTFTISDSDDPGDGLAFFIAPVNTVIPTNSEGKLLGLFGSTALKNSTSDNKVDPKASTGDVLKNSISDNKVGLKASSGTQVVAVEFDTYINTDVGDPNFRHIGIDVNSIRSRATATWNWENARVVTARISYNSVTKRLGVVANYPGAAPVTLSDDIELNTVLPDWVRVGFSASTGAYTQSSTLLSWSFSSGLALEDTVQEKENMLIASVV